MITLAITPLRWLTGINQLVNYRRLIGLFAFFYGSMHFITYVVTSSSSRAFELRCLGLFEDLRRGPYIIAGFTAFVLMIPLAVTSTAGWIRRLGGKNWNRLHRLIYITAMAAVLHYYWKVSIKLCRQIRSITASGRDPAGVSASGDTLRSGRHLRYNGAEMKTVWKCACCCVGDASDA